MDMPKLASFSDKKTIPTQAHVNRETTFWPKLTSNDDKALRERAAARICEVLGAVNVPFETSRVNRFAYLNQRFEACGNLRRAADGQFDYIWLPATGRFGNNVIQIGHAIIAASRCKIAVIHHPFSWLPDEVHLNNGVRLVFSNPDIESPDAGIRHGFFEDFRTSAVRLSPEDHFVHIMRNIIAKVVPWLPQKRTNRLITAHIRGGDVMIQRNSVHGNYGQPPFAYYAKATENLIERFGADTLEIISVDRSNPTFDALEYWATQKGLKVRAMPNTFDHDVQRLLCAEHLIAGFSSFTATLALMSSNISTYYYFNEGHKTEAAITCIPEVFVGKDTSNAFIPFGAWRNTIEQRRQLVHHPLEDIEIAKATSATHSRD